VETKNKKSSHFLFILVKFNKCIYDYKKKKQEKPSEEKTKKQLKLYLLDKSI